MSDPAPPQPRHVLITTAIVVQVPEGDGFEDVEPFADTLRKAITDAFRGSPAVEYPEAMSFIQLEEAYVNVGKCAECGCWVSDYTKPETLEGIPGGRVVDGRWLCDECETFGERAENEPTSETG